MFFLSSETITVFITSLLICSLLFGLEETLLPLYFVCFSSMSAERMLTVCSLGSNKVCGQSVLFKDEQHFVVIMKLSFQIILLSNQIILSRVLFSHMIRSILVFYLMVKC